MIRKSKGTNFQKLGNVKLSMEMETTFRRQQQDFFKVYNSIIGR